MTESEACALLKARFEKAGYAIAENVPFDEDGIRFDIDGFDAGKRVGYEYITDEAGDTWDVDGDVIAALDARRAAGELFVLVVAEASAPDAKALGRAADEFLATLANGGGHTAKPKKAAPKKPAAPKKKPAAKLKARR
jgi:hypothetical protein